MDISHFKKRLLYGLYYKNVPFQIYNTRPRITNAEDIETPNHLRIFFTSNLANSTTDDNNHTSESTKTKAQILEAAYTAALKVQWTTKGLVTAEGNEDENSMKEQQLEEEDSDDDEDHRGGSQGDEEEDNRNSKEEQELFCRTADWDAIEKILSNASIVVGMHPDQAAEHIVDFALKRFVFIELRNTVTCFPSLLFFPPPPPF